MGLLDLFTGAASKTAAKNNQGAIATGLAQGTQALNNTYGQGLAYLVQGNDPNALSSLGAGYTQARQDIGSQYDQTQGFLGELGSLYRPMAQTGQQAFNAYNDAIGSNGAEGNARATAAFQASPGYAYSMDQALGAVQRTAAARGGLAGGNATADLLKTATGLADQDYGEYVNRLAQGSAAYGQGIAGQAGALGQQATASQGYGNALGALGTGLGAAQAGAYGQAAQLEGQYGNAFAGMTNNATNSLVQNNNNLAQSQNAAGANILGALVGFGNIFSGKAGNLAGKGGFV